MANLTRVIYRHFSGHLAFEEDNGGKKEKKNFEVWYVHADNDEMIIYEWPLLDSTILEGTSTSCIQ